MRNDVIKPSRIGHNNGSFTNTASVASGGVGYFDADPANNTTSVSYTVDPGTDIEALGDLPARCSDRR